MGDAVRRVQKHLQELSRDHLTSVEDRHHANLGWLQVSLQQLCKQIEVDVRVELTRPPRLSFSKPLQPLTTNADAKRDSHSATATNTTATNARAEAVKAKASTRLEFDAMVDEEPPRASKKQREEESASGNDVVMTETDEPSIQEKTKKTETITVTKTRKVLKPKKIVTKVKTLVKKPKAELPAVDVGALKVVDLKNELKKRGLKQTGVKAVLVSRLKEALAAEDAEVEEEEVEEEVEIVEEIMEEVDEDYEEEVKVVDEQEHDEVVVVDAEADVVVIDDDQDEEISMATRQAPKPKRAEKKERLQAEATRMSMEGVNVVDISMGAKHTLDTDSATQDTQVDRYEPETTAAATSPKKSLSDMVSPPASDEIVRESDLGSQGLMSPERKSSLAAVVSAQKSPVKPQTQASAATEVVVKALDQKESEDHSVAKIASHASAKIEKTAIDASTKAKASRGQSSAPIDIFARATQLASGDDGAKRDSAPELKTTVGSDKLEARETGETAVRSKPQSAAAALSSSVLAKTMAATDRALKAAAAAAAVAAEHTAKASSAPTASVSAPTVTPAREILARLKSLTPGAASDRSSSASSYAASRRYAGSTNFVEDSQPDQSPHPHVSFAPDVASQATRAASSSQLELQAIASKMKTPDSTLGAQSTGERVAQSEPRVAVAKIQVVDEAERKRQEQQENIQREAQRLRMAAKQSARKRFEEAKSSNLLWAKRDQTPTGSSGPSLSTAERSGSANSSTPITPTSTIESTPATSASSFESLTRSEEKMEKKTVDLEETVSVQTAKAPVASAASAKISQLELEKRSVASATTKSADASTKKDPEPTKRALQTRKRSSIAIDTSTSTLYPSKKRASITRASNIVSDPPVAKQTSLTKDKPAEIPRKRTSTSREALAVEAAKRRRSSESRDKPVPVSAANKRTSITSKRSSITSEASAKSTTRSIPTIVSRAAAATAMSRRDSASSTISSSSNVSASDSRSKAGTSAMAGGAVRKPANLVSGLHSFTSLLEKDSSNLSSSQGSNTSSSSRAPAVSALKLAEKSRLLEQKKNLEKAKRKEALAKRYEEQRKADEEKRKKVTQMKEKAERDARLKREQEQAAEKKQKDLELAKKRQQRLQEMRSGMEKKKTTEKDSATTVSKTSATVAPVSRVAASTSSTGSSSSVVLQSTKSAVGKGAASKELTTYAMSEHEESESDDDEKDTKRNEKNIPKWAQREHLERTLKIQFGPNAIDPTPSIFPDFVDSCDLEAIFEPTDVRKKKRFQRRTSSGNWLADRPTAREKAIYKRDMGFQR